MRVRLMSAFAVVVVIAAAMGMSVLLTAGCTSADPATSFIAQMDQLPPEKRVPNYDQLRAKMLRPAPVVGAAAPDFALLTADGSQTIRRSSFSPGKPQVLIFGSWT